MLGMAPYGAPYGSSVADPDLILLVHIRVLYRYF